MSKGGSPRETFWYIMSMLYGGKWRYAVRWNWGRKMMMSGEEEILGGQCHGGAVRFEVRLGVGFAMVRRRTCRYYRMRGAVVVSAAMDGIRFMRRDDRLNSYRFNTGAAAHFLRAVRNLQASSAPFQSGQIWVNVACLDGVDPFDFTQVAVFGGVAHAKDTGGPARLAGMLRF